MALMDRAEDHGRRRAVGGQPIEEYLRRGFGIGRVGIARLFRKGKAAQPVEQVLSRCGEHAVLRKVDMRIDEARQDQAVAEIIHRCLAIACGKRGAWRRATGCARHRR